MWSSSVLVCAAAAAVAQLRAVSAQADPAQFVDTLIGTSNGGHVFAGATLPWGSVKAGADSNSTDKQGGYVSDGSPITGISQLHDDGTGGGASLGNFPLLPLTDTQCGSDLKKCTVDQVGRAMAHGTPNTSPGYFSIPLNNSVLAEVTVTEHVAVHRFTYPAGTKQMVLIVDATNDLAGTYENVGSTALRINPTTKGTQISGTGAYQPSFGESTFQVHYCFDSPVPFDTAQFYQNVSGKLHYRALSKKASFAQDIGAQSPAGFLLGFDTPSRNVSSTLVVRMGISWTSPEKACQFAAAEVPAITSASFDSVKTAARAKWNEVFSTVQLDTTNVPHDTQVLFWSSLYRTYISPTNITGDNPLWVSNEPYYDSFYCIWDSFRVVHPLYAITAPKTQTEVVRALIDIYRHTGWLPDCRMSLDKGFLQGGSNADSLLADSFLKGIKAGIDWETGYKAMVKDATVPGDFSVQGRGGIAARAALGFIPVNDTSDNPPNEGPNTRSASRLLEYAYNDFGIGLVAQGLGKTGDQQKYFAKSGDWFNIWNPNATNTGFHGFIQPRTKNGSWYFDPRWDVGDVFRPDHCSPSFGPNDCFLNPDGGEFYEASSWEYSWFVPQDMAKLIKAMGGPQTASARLDAYFANNFGSIGDEPGFLPTYLYNYFGQPTKTVDRVAETLSQNFSTAVDGLPGNDDSGAMGAYAVWSLLGFYPVAGQDTYLLSRPHFPQTKIRNQLTGNVATITAQGLSATNIYIQSATLNGKSYTKNWISHQLFLDGGELILVMGASKDSTWGTGQQDLPMSLSTGGFV
ncbi:unnamed protein product [Mycena citricolor]|uniref:Glycoside hydrolase family 92 protein n=1 Tax=Mycena citricolor TaxID=2018698 RepID=A0AAD2JXH4_9AGAR|nr:unnamed protein product [Mycena citricolor]CAK5267821.1 unnamed protein product [Mycena citricolor]